MLKELRPLMCCLLISGTPEDLAAEVDVSSMATVTTDYMFRGVSQTLSAAALQLEIEFEQRDGWFAYVFASNVAFSPAGTPDDGAALELNFAGGYAVELTDRLTAVLDATAYVFPGTRAEFDYDYTEWHGTLELDAQHELKLGYSDNVFASGADGTFVSLTMAQDLTEQIAMGLEIGHYDLEHAYGSAYSYAELSLSGESRGFEWRLAYFSVSDSASELFYESTVEDRFVLTVSVPFFATRR